MKSEEQLNQEIKELEQMLSHVKKTESKEAYEVILQAYYPLLNSQKKLLIDLQSNNA